MIAENALSGRNAPYKLCLGRGNLRDMTSMFVTNVYVLLFKMLSGQQKERKIIINNLGLYLFNVSKISPL